MPDLQSELNKILTQQQFDDDVDAKSPVVVEPAIADSMRYRAWEYVKNHPGCTVGDIAAALGVSTPNIAGGLHKMVMRGNLTRQHRDDGAGYRYQVAGDEYKIMSVEDRIASMHKARAQLVAKRKAAPRRKPIKPKIAKAAPAPAAKPAADTQAFDADEIIAGLTVLQARELLVKLKEVFGV